MNPKLFQVLPTDDYEVYLYYDNGEIKLYDCKWILNSKGIFKNIQSIEKFKSMCCIMNGTLAWDINGNCDNTYCIDICPDTIYEDSIKVNHDILSA